MTVQLAKAKDADLDRVLVFMEAYYAYDGLPFDRAQAGAALQRLLGDDTLGTVWLIIRDDDAVGYIVLTPGYSLEYLGRDAFIDEFFIDEASRGQGIGRQVMALVEAEARALDVRALHLEVERENQPAQAFYRKAGYTDHDRYLLTRWLD